MSRFKTILFDSFELLMVLLLGFGLFWGSAFKDGPVSTGIIFSSHQFYILVILEVVLLSVVSSILKFRKWKLKDFNLGFNWSLPLIAIVLVLVRIGLGAVLRILFSGLGFDMGQPADIQLEASLLSCILVVLINSIYEEALLLGYLFKRLEKFSPVIIILISLILRESYHLYQGWYRLPSGIALGLVYGVYYFKYRKLWPPIMAHGITNALSFLSIYYQWEWLDW